MSVVLLGLFALWTFGVFVAIGVCRAASAGDSWRDAFPDPASAPSTGSLSAPTELAFRTSAWSYSAASPVE